MRVGFVVHSMHVAGAEMLVVETIAQLSRHMVPTLFCLDSIGTLGGALVGAGVEVVGLGRRPGRDLGLVLRLARAVRMRRIEVLHAHQYTPFFYAALARLLCGGQPRLMFTEHGRHYPDQVSRLRRVVNRTLLCHLADAVNAVCAFSAQRLREADGFTRTPIAVIENGVHVERYGRAVDRLATCAQLGLDPQRRYVATVARLHPVKDQATLLRAFQRVAAQRPDVDLLVVGDGPLRAALAALAQSLGIGPRIHFLGSRNDVPVILSAVDVFALTSLSEAASLTLLEAMASQLPVVVTAVGGNAEIVRPGIEGLLVARGDALAAAKAILQLLECPEIARSLGAAAALRVRTRYRIERTIETYLQLYQRLARGEGGAA